MECQFEESSFNQLGPFHQRLWSVISPGENAMRSSISWVFFANDMSPFFRGNIFLNSSNSVCFEGLETLTSSIDPIKNKGTVSEGIKIAGWDSQDSLEMFHEL